MSNRSQSHHQAWESIPWVVNGSASEAQTRATREHLRGCADCREALAFEQRLRDALTSQQPEVGDAARGWQSLNARLDDSPAGSRQVYRPTPERAWAATSIPIRWLAAAVIVEALALGAIVTSSWISRTGQEEPVGAYRTLSQIALPRAAPTIRVVLSPSMTLEQLRVLLNSAQLQVVAGPGESGVWSLAPADYAAVIATEAALRELRGSPQVRFAEPIATGAGASSP
jgi:hypothetical protein